MSLGFLYTYACHEAEEDLCRLELESLFAVKPTKGYVESKLQIDPSRSPFIKQRVSLLFTGANLAEIIEHVKTLELNGATFKVVFLDIEQTVIEGYDFTQKRSIEGEVGWVISGKAEMRTPELQFAIFELHGGWLFGEVHGNEALWLKHQQKPQNYSTALNTRMARAVVNIAVPNVPDVRAVDPCCGMGTVLVEALSMGIDIVGFDINPLAVLGARANMKHFGYNCSVGIKDMRQISETFDAAILDLPYNLCSVLPEEEQLEMLVSTHRLAKRAIIIATENIEAQIVQAGFLMQDRCIVKKAAFTRFVFVCV